MIWRLQALIAVSGVFALSLTFFHPAMWAPVAAVLGLALLILIPLVMREAQQERPAFFVALIWLATTFVIALFHGFAEQLYNVKQVLLVLGGLLFGYALSLRALPGILAWAPFWAFAAYFGALLILGRDANDVFARNSENYVSVILLALYAAAAIMTRPDRVMLKHLAAAGATLVLSIWAAGRGGILASLILTGWLAFRRVTQRQTGLPKLLFAVATISIAAAAIYFAAGYLDEAGLLYKFEGRGLRDPSRLTILKSYFDDIAVSELLFGRNYYDDSVIGRWGFNLHNSYLDAWAHLGVLYLLFVVFAVALVFMRRQFHPVLAIAVLAFAARAVTDSQLLAGQYDFVFFSALFVLLRPAAARTHSQPMAAELPAALGARK